MSEELVSSAGLESIRVGRWETRTALPCPAVEELPFMGACTVRLQRGHGFVLPAMLSFI